MPKARLENLNNDYSINPERLDQEFGASESIVKYSSPTSFLFFSSRVLSGSSGSHRTRRIVTIQRKSYLRGRNHPFRFWNGAVHRKGLTFREEDLGARKLE